MRDDKYECNIDIFDVMNEALSTAKDNEELEKRLEIVTDMMEQLEKEIADKKITK